MYKWRFGISEMELVYYGCSVNCDDDMESDRENLLAELQTIELLLKENPCAMPASLMQAIVEVVHSFIGQHCVDGATKEMVAKYLHRDVRTITRWREHYDDFPKGKMVGRKELLFNWIDIVQWKMKHPELFEKG